MSDDENEPVRDNEALERELEDVEREFGRRQQRVQELGRERNELERRLRSVVPRRHVVTGSALHVVAAEAHREGIQRRLKLKTAALLQANDELERARQRREDLMREIQEGLLEEED